MSEESLTTAQFVTKALPPEMLECRMYADEFPQVNHTVMYLMVQLLEHGMICALPEYQGREAMVVFSTRSVPNFAPGAIAAGVVTRVDKEMGYIDISSRRMCREDRTQEQKKYRWSTRVHEVMAKVSVATGVSMLSLYMQFGWDLYVRFGHAWSGLNGALADHTSMQQIRGELQQVLPVDLVGVTMSYLDFILARYELSPSLMAAIAQATAKVVRNQAKHGLAYLEITSYGPKGVDHIRDCFAALQARFPTLPHESDSQLASCSMSCSSSMSFGSSLCPSFVSEFSASVSTGPEFSGSLCETTPPTLPLDSLTSISPSSSPIIMAPVDDDVDSPLSLSVIEAPLYIMALEFEQDQREISRLSLAIQTFSELLSTCRFSKVMVIRAPVLAIKSQCDDIRKMVRLKKLALVESAAALMGYFEPNVMHPSWTEEDDGSWIVWLLYRGNDKLLRLLDQDDSEDGRRNTWLL